MVMLTVVLCFVVSVQARTASSRFRRSDWFGQQTQCAGGYSVGETVTIKNYWYKCLDDGNLQPLGCIDSNNRRVEFGDTWIEADYEMKCLTAFDGKGQIIVSGCYDRDTQRSYTTQEIWQSAKFWYECAKGRYENQVVIETRGCVYEGTRMNLNEERQGSTKLYSCKTVENGNIALCAVGCVVDGQVYRSGQQFDDGQVCYACQERGRDARAVPIGCVNEQRYYFHEQTFTREDTVYQCLVDKSTESVRERVYGCSDYGRTYPIGEQWTRGSYTYECQRYGPDVRVLGVRCQYNDRGRKTALKVGCMRMTNTQMVGCTKRGDELELVRFGPDQLDVAIRHSLRTC